jgi:hypothetical protein
VYSNRGSGLNSLCSQGMWCALDQVQELVVVQFNRFDPMTAAAGDVGCLSVAAARASACQGTAKPSETWKLRSAADSMELSNMDDFVCIGTNIAYNTCSIQSVSAVAAWSASSVANS